LAWATGGLAGATAGTAAALAGAGSVAMLVPCALVLAAWALVAPVPDPIRPTDDPLDRFVPWASSGARRPWPGLPAALARAPATLAYLLASWVLFLALSDPGLGAGIDTARLEPWLYEIPDLTEAPLEVLRALGTAPLLNHDVVQLVYVTALLGLFGLVVEVREGTARAAGAFAAGSLAGALVAGVLLYPLVALVPGSDLLAHAWERTWSGGSAGAFGLVGALAARARTPWPLLGFFAFWELNVGLFYLESYTPAFHLTALVTGFLLARRAWSPPGAGSTGRTRSPTTPTRKP
jgi:hypothetical protein